MVKKQTKAEIHNKKVEKALKKHQEEEAKGYGSPQPSLYPIGMKLVVDNSSGTFFLDDFGVLYKLVWSNKQTQTVLTPIPKVKRFLDE